jgi:F-type H+-transporting ATPase subunit a
MSGEALTINGYIKHHLTNLTYGKLPEGYVRTDAQGEAHTLANDTWTMAHGAEESSAMGFNAIHVDSMAWSIGLGLIFCWLFRRVAKKASSGVPSGSVNLV